MNTGKILCTLFLFLSLILFAGNSLLSLCYQSESHTETNTPKYGDEKVVHVVKINSSINLDGKLNEPYWQQCEPAGDFIQQEPQDGAPATEKTEFKILMDDKNFYFGIICYDSEPDKIIGIEMKRDARLFNNDNIEIFLDTFNDKKNCYYFQTNPVAARYDAMVTDEGKSVNADWNTIWRVSCRQHEKGWTAEISIPFHAIRFKEGETSWGINIGREIRRKTEKTFWSYIPRALGMNGKYRVSRCGRMEGIEELTKGKDFEIIPYLGGSKNSGPALVNQSTELEYGGDILYRITGNLRADFSYNTDFAQVEADQEVVNVSRFNLFFPEKREFFLENSGLFTFGNVSFSERMFTGRISSGSEGEGNSYLLYYSRRIGLKDEDKIPLYGGTKLAGKIGKSSIGFMSMQTKETALSTGGTEPSTNYTTFRLKQDVLRNSSIGLIFLNKQSSSNNYNRAFGIDGNFPLTTSFTMGGSLAKTITPNITGDDYAGTFFMDYRTDIFTWNIKYLRLDDNFNPEMGFVARDKIRSTYSTAQLIKWINKHGFKNVSLSTTVLYITDNQNVLDTRRVSGSLKINFTPGDDITFSVNDYHESLNEDEYISDVLVPGGDYKYNSYRIYYNSNHSRMFSGGIGYNWGNNYKGIKRTFSPHFHFRPSRHFIMDCYYDYNHMVLPEGKIYSNVLSNRMTYMFNPEMYLKAYIQWNDYDNRLSANILFHLIHNAANNFYLVYNENRDPDTPGAKIKDRMVMAKFVYHLFM